MLSNRDSSSKLDQHVLFEDLVSQYGEELMRLAFTYVKNLQATEDIVQDVFMLAYEKRDYFRGEATYRTYLYRMTINRSYDYLRSWSFKSVFISDKIASFFHHVNSTESEVLINDERHMIGNEVLSLPLKYREVLVLYYYKELSIEEIAHIFQCSGNTIKTRLRRAREQLKVQLLKEGEKYDGREKIKESIDYVIGDGKLFTNQIQNRVLSNVLKTKPQEVPLLNKLKPILALLLLLVGSVTYFYLSYDFNGKITTADKGIDGVVEKPISDSVIEPVDPSHLYVNFQKHGEPFSILEQDLKRVMSTTNPNTGILEPMNNSINGVSIDDAGMVMVELNDFRSEVPNPSLQLLDSLLETLYDTIFKYPEVTSAMFNFDGNLTTWKEWSSTGPMLRQHFDLNTHGVSFPELENDLNNLMSHGYVFDTRNVEVLVNSVNGVSINEYGTLVVEFKDFRQEFGSLTSNEKGLFLQPLSDTVFKYPEVKEVYFTFEGSFNDWYKWLEFTPEPMTNYAEIDESHDTGDLSPDSPNFYSLEELAKMTPDELKAIGYPNPYEEFK